MKVTSHILDIEAYEAGGYRPATLIPREKGETWLVRDRPIGETTDPAKDWAWAADSEQVRVPLFPYLSHGNDPAVALAFSAELCIKVLLMVQTDYEILRIHIAYGSPVQEVSNIPDVNQPLLRFWAGFGFLVKEKKRG